MDFHSLARRDLQFLCKRNKIPANMTNLAMADSLKALEIVEGLDEYMNQSDSNAPHSPTTVAKQPPNTATRTTRRKTAVKAEPQSTSQLVNPSCPVANSVKFEASVAKTPAARTTRKASAATSCSSKVQESKKVDTVQSVYSTRRSTRLLEKCMADLSLKTHDTKPEKNQVSAHEDSPAGSEEAQVIPGRDLSASMEKEWEILKTDSDQAVVDLGEIAVLDANIETDKEKMDQVMGDEKESENCLVQADKEEETLQVKCEESPKKIENEHEMGDLDLMVNVDLDDTPVLEYAKTEMNNDAQEVSKNVQVQLQVEQQEVEEVNEEDGSELADTMVDQTDGDSESESEEADSGSDTISEADSDQAVLGSEVADEEMILHESEGSSAAADAPTSLVEEEDKVKATPLKKPDLEMVNVNNNKENNMEMMMMTDVVVNNKNGEGEAKKKKVEIVEENLKDVSIRQLVKMVKELSIKSTNSRTALQALPADNV